MTVGMVGTVGMDETCVTIRMMVGMVGMDETCVTTVRMTVGMVGMVLPIVRARFRSYDSDLTKQSPIL